MNDSTQLLTTVAQLSGGLVAIIAGFVLSKVLGNAYRRQELMAKYRRETQELTDSMKDLGISTNDLVHMNRAQDMERLTRERDQITWDIEMFGDYSHLLRAMLSLIPSYYIWNYIAGGTACIQ